MCVILCCSVVASPSYYKETLELIEKTKENNLSFDDILLLESLDKMESRIGYNLCIESGVESWSCEREGSLGYGLFIAAGEDYWNCEKDAAVGYGICIAAGIESWNCEKSGDIAYGLCVASGVNYWECTPE